MPSDKSRRNNDFIGTTTSSDVAGVRRATSARMAAGAEACVWQQSLLRPLPAMAAPGRAATDLALQGSPGQGGRVTLLLLLVAAGIWAGAQNALAGGGSFITLPALIAAGLDPKLANITSTIALFPGQMTTGLAGRSLVCGAERLSFSALAIIAFSGGIGGAFLLIATPATVFSAMVPWLVFGATALFGWSSFGSKSVVASAPPPAWVTVATQSLIGLYGGFFGGGAGIMTLASLTLARLPVRNAAATKNVLIALSNLSAAAIFAFSGTVQWREALAIGAGAMLGGYLGARALKVLPERALKIGVIVIGVALTIALFLRA